MAKYTPICSIFTVPPDNTGLRGTTINTRGMNIDMRGTD